MKICDFRPHQTSDLRGLPFGILMYSELTHNILGFKKIFLIFAYIHNCTISVNSDVIEKSELNQVVDTLECSSKILHLTQMCTLQSN